jgi:hypothetical protein
MNKHKISLWEVILFLFFALWAGGTYYLAVIGKFESEVLLNVIAVAMILSLLYTYVYNWNKRNRK